MTQTPRKTIVWKAGAMELKRASHLAKYMESAQQSVIYDCAKLLRHDIRGQKVTHLEESFTVEKIMSGEIDTPKSVTDFFSLLYSEGDGEKKQRLANSSAADVVYGCSGGSALPGKHLALGLTLKSMTGSKSVVTLMNCFGHCASGETVRRIDMGLESTTNSSTTNIPSEIVRKPNLGTAMAWDNFDINIETLSGAGTIHHTYGICFQNEVLTEEPTNNICNLASTKVRKLAQSADTH